MTTYEAINNELKTWNNIIQDRKDNSLYNVSNDFPIYPENGYRIVEKRISQEDKLTFIYVLEFFTEGGQKIENYTILGISSTQINLSEFIL